MRPAERIPILKKLAQALSDEATMEWAEMELVLRQFGFDVVVNAWSDEDYPSRYNFALHQLEHGGDDDKLLELERYLDPAAESPSASEAGDGNGRVPALDVQGPWKGEDTFRLFISHTHPHAGFAGDMSKHLAKFGIECFVAHQDIKPSEKWQEVIESALLTCHAATALVTKDFRQSVWCDQEVGFCLARALVIVPLMAGIEPHGFLASFQAVKLAGTQDRGAAWKAGEDVFEILAKRPETRERMVPCVVRRYSASYSYDNSRAAYEMLRTIPQESWTLEMVKEVEEAAIENSQIREGSLDGGGGPIPKAAAELLAPIKDRLAPEPDDELELVPFPDDDIVPASATKVTPSGDDDIPF
jgi:TIR domain